jgi:light-regulated signal transduction histidine kinase (bacteriophytochrome)
MMKSLYEFLHVNHVEILSILQAHCIIVQENDNEGRMIFGDASLIVTPDGSAELMKKAVMKSILAISTFSHGLSGLGAGVLVYKHYFSTIIIVRKSRIHDVHWGGSPDDVLDQINPLTPRKSFERYVEKSRVESKNWSACDLDLASTLFERIAQYLHDQMLSSVQSSLDQSNADCVKAMESAEQHYEFFAHMSHELRTPFHGVMSTLQILGSAGSSIDENEKQELVNGALDCGKIMLGTLNDILTIAKNRSCADLNRTPIVASTIVRSTFRMLSAMATTKGTVI